MRVRSEGFRGNTSETTGHGGETVLGLVAWERLGITQKGRMKWPRRERPGLPNLGFCPSGRPQISGGKWMDGHSDLPFSSRTCHVSQKNFHRKGPDVTSANIWEGKKKKKKAFHLNPSRAALLLTGQLLIWGP